MSSQPRTILVLEDNEDDLFLLRRAVAAADLEIALRIAADGQEAIDYLSGAGRYGDRTYHPRPDLVILDLKLPLISGLQALAWIRHQSDCPALPVVVLTSSYEERDRERATALGVIGYHVKPPTPAFVRELAEALRQLAPISASGPLPRPRAP